MLHQITLYTLSHMPICLLYQCTYMYVANTYKAVQVETLFHSSESNQATREFSFQIKIVSGSKNRIAYFHKLAMVHVYTCSMDR